ncbi:MAG TPA: hypothetical protein VKW06_05510 [Candidatus Angelobacter sp.]|nr:hypothetical protein [Candidatus Angelobacter sp.]
MKSNPKASSEYEVFEKALKTVLSVPRSELQRREEEYQKQRMVEKKKRAKTLPASRASRDKG